MATYKVIQDIEAEDKLIGPLSFRQFVYAGICALCLYLSFLLISKGAAFVAVVFLPVILLSGFFAFPWGRDQPTEVWALARIRFMLKPRRRIWNQSGVKELVTITAPKQLGTNYTNGLTQTEVQSRLRALADTIDSRGWVVKNANLNLYGQPELVMGEPASDRLVAVESLPRGVSNVEVLPSDDMMDEHNSPVARQFDSMIQTSAKNHRQQILDRLQGKQLSPSPAQQQQPTPASNNTAPANNYWFLNPPSRSATSAPQDAVTFNAQVVAPGAQVTGLPAPMPGTPTSDEEALLQQLGTQPQLQANPYGHLHTVLPLSAQQARAAQQPVAPPVQPTLPPAIPPVTQSPAPAILDLANNDDLNVATIAREAQKRTEPPQDEVVISLH
ncbi:MAG TPA: PrgI family protein [Nevskiaceae bacterium]|nr:PrgI family protein [Nevskiaceae bacterium]